MISAVGNGAWVVWAAIEGVWWFFATTIAAVTMSVVVALIVSIRQRAMSTQESERGVGAKEATSRPIP